MTFRHTLLLLLVFALAACQANPTQPVVTAQPTGAAQTPTAEANSLPPTFTPVPSPTPVPTGPPGVDPASLRGVEVHFWHPWMETLAAESEALVSEFNRTNEWGITVHARGFATSGELYDAVLAALEEDPTGVPDTVAALSEQIAAWDEGYQVVYPLDPLLAHAQLGMPQAERETFYPVFWNQERHQGRQLAIPLLRSAHVLFYNVTWAKELGFNVPPRTPEQFQQQACAAAVENNSANRSEKYGTGGWLVDTDALTLLSWIGAFGGNVVAEAGDPPYTFRTDEAEDALAYLGGLMEQGCAWLPRSQTRHEAFARRLALFVTGSLSDIAVQERISTRVGGGDQWTVLPFPAAQGDPQAWSSGYSLAVLGSPTSEDAQDWNEQLAAWLFVRWLARPENTLRLAQQLPSLPVTTAVEAQLASASGYPADRILPLRENARPAPGLASWRTVRRLVSDAAWQVFHLPADQRSIILPQLEDTARELLRREP